jgi:soluble lytic murein transglycosylase-like protein
MNLDVDAIFRQKLAEINSRLSSSVSGLTTNDTSSSDIPFEKYLSEASLLGLDGSLSALTGDSTSALSSTLDLTDLLGKLGSDKSSNVIRARNALSNSTAYIPSDSTELMNLINSGIDSAAEKYGVDKDLIRAIMKQESSFNPSAISTSGAQGLMQLMPGTADALSVRNPFDILQNINGGVQYLKDQVTTFKGDVSLALAAYNAGPNSVKKYGGIPPYAETQNYVQNVNEYYNQYKMLTNK